VPKTAGRLGPPGGSSVLGHGGTVDAWQVMRPVHTEGEVCLIIGRTARHVSRADAWSVVGEPRDDVFAAKSGFGGTEYLLPGLVTAAARRGLPLGRVAVLTAAAPARRFGLHTKGVIAAGYDADIALVDRGRAGRCGRRTRSPRRSTGRSKGSR